MKKENICPLKKKCPHKFFKRNNLWLEQNITWKPAFTLNTNSWKPAFHLNRNSWTGRYQRFLITISATCTLQNLRKHLWKQWLSVKFKLMLLMPLLDIRLIFINDKFYTNWNNHPEVFYPSTLNSKTQLDSDLLLHKVIYF